MLNVAIQQSLHIAVQHKAVCQINIISEGKVRKLHPYGLLLNKKGKYILVCWQEGGYSKSGKLPNFRNLPIDDVGSIEITNKAFMTSEQFRPDNKMYHNWQFFAQ